MPAAPSAPTPPSLEELFTGTVSLTDRDQIELAMKAPVPFAQAPGAAPPPPKGVTAADVAAASAAKSGKPLEPAPNNDSLFETCALDAAEAQRALSKAPTPFAQRPAEAPAPPKTGAVPVAGSPWAGPPGPGTGSGQRRG
jgi:hypothetical protein